MIFAFKKFIYAYLKVLTEAWQSYTYKRKFKEGNKI